jgi:hypothetical protein
MRNRVFFGHTRRAFDNDTYVNLFYLHQTQPVPSISLITAGSFGRRASNNSATRGKPPVMSRVLPAPRGILAIKSDPL